MPDASPEKAADPPLAPLSVSLVLATLFIGGVTFVCGTVTFTVIGSVLFGISLDDRQLLACGSMAAAVMAVVTAWRWCRNARRRAALSASDTVGNRRVFQFTLRSFLALPVLRGSCPRVDSLARLSRGSLRRRHCRRRGRILAHALLGPPPRLRRGGFVPFWNTGLADPVCHHIAQKTHARLLQRGEKLDGPRAPSDSSAGRGRC